MTVGAAGSESMFAFHAAASFSRWEADCIKDERIAKVIDSLHYGIALS